MYRKEEKNNKYVVKSKWTLAVLNIVIIIYCGDCIL